MCCMQLAGNTGHKNDAKNHHLCTITQLCLAISSQLRHVSIIRKKVVKQQYVLQMSWQYGELLFTNGWDQLASFGHPSKFQWVLCLGFVTAATSLTAGQPNFARCLVVSWAGTLHVYTFLGAVASWWNFATCKIHFAFKSCVLLYWRSHCTTLQQQTSAKLCSVVQGMELGNFRRGCHLYSPGRLSRWASANILVYSRNWS